MSPGRKSKKTRFTGLKCKNIRKERNGQVVKGFTDQTGFLYLILEVTGSHWSLLEELVGVGGKRGQSIGRVFILVAE